MAQNIRKIPNVSSVGKYIKKLLALQKKQQKIISDFIKKKENLQKKDLINKIKEY